MKKKILALLCAAVMVTGMGITAFASPSPTAGSDTGNGKNSATADGVVSSTPAPASAPATTFSVGGGTQTFSEATLSFFATDTKVEGGVVTAVSADTAKEAIAEANKLYGDDTFVASVVDITVPNVAFPYKLTINCSNVWAGQRVTVLHKVGDTWERLNPNNVSDNSLTVTVNSFSPFVIVIDTNPTSSPKTGDVSLLVSGLAGLFGAGSILTRKKIRK